MKISRLFAFTLTALLAFFWAVHADTPDKKVPIYFFWGQGCGYCETAKPFLRDLSQRYPTVELKMYEVWNNAENRKLLKSMASVYGDDPKSVPVTFVGKQYFVGFNEKVAKQIEMTVKECLKGNCSDKNSSIIPME